VYVFAPNEEMVIIFLFLSSFIFVNIEKIPVKFTNGVDGWNIESPAHKILTYQFNVTISWPNNQI
jgi:hypothetical protein